MSEPMYQQIAVDLRRSTVRDAIRQLASLGPVGSRPGTGTFVKRKIDPFITVLTPDLDASYGGEGATRLAPWSLQTSFYPMELAARKAPCPLVAEDDQNGNPARVTVTVYPTERSQFIVNIGHPPDSPCDHDAETSAAKAYRAKTA